MLRELVDVIARSFVILDHGNWEKSPRAGEKHVTPIFKKGGKKGDLGSFRLVSLTLIPGKLMDQLTLETVFRHIRDKEMISSQHSFTKASSARPT